MEENNNLNELPKKKGSSTIVLIVVCVVAFAVGFAVSFFTGDKKDKKDTKGTSNEVSNVESNSNQASNETSNEVSNQTSNDISNTPTSNTNTNNNVVSSELEKDITNKIALLFGAYTYNGGKSIISARPDNMGKYIINNKLNEERKTDIIINSLKPYTTKKITKKDIKIRQEDRANILNETGDDIDYYSTAEIAKKFRNLFGTNPTYVDVNGCPGYQYDFNSKDYISISGCGFVSHYTNYAYVDSMVKSGKQVNVKVYASTIFNSPEGNTYYKDVDLKSKTSKYTIIKESNKKTFASYTLVFKSDSNGNYYFSNAVK